ncbi:MAG: patatin-like phospholipase family protein [Alphaproteobacteria bacterium]|nr:patatin-like phospholipase family protein [Alphaproteobacteria bacterium]
MSRIVRILSIDGGGIRGLIPAMALAEIEQRSNRRIADLFHLLVGTSTGGMMALGLVRPQAGSRPMTASEVARVFRHEGPDVFSRTVWKEVSSLGGITEEKYDSSMLERYLKKNLGETRLSEALADIMLTAYDLRHRAPYFFKSWKAQGRQLGAGETAAQHDFLMRDVARAATAAPTYFEPAVIRNAVAERFVFVDGGVYANNPAMCAYVSASKLFPNADAFMLVSLSTGLPDIRLPAGDAGSWGMAAWARPILDMIIDGVGHTVHRHMKDLLGDDYFRFRVDLKSFSSGEPGPTQNLANASPENLERLIRKAETMLVASAGQLDRLVDRLCAEPPTNRRLLGYPAIASKDPAEMFDDGLQPVEPGQE